MSTVNPMARKRIVLEVPGDRPIAVRKDITVPIDDGDPVRIDVYEPLEANPRAGAVVIVSGYRDAGYRSVMGCSFRETGWVVSWAELLASSGLATIAYSAESPDDVHHLLARIEAGTIEGVGGPIGLLASSGHGPLAMSLLSRQGATKIRSAALLYPYTIDLEGSSIVTEAATTFRFTNPATSLSDLSEDVRLLLVRAGRDEMPGLSSALDAFATAALERNLPVSVANLPTAPHAFDLFKDEEATLVAIRQTVEFLKASLTSRDGDEALQNMARSPME